MAATEEEFIAVLKEQPSTDYIKSLVPKVTSVKGEFTILDDDTTHDAKLFLVHDPLGKVREIQCTDRVGGAPRWAIGSTHGNDKVVITQLKDADIEFILPTGNNITAKIGTVFHTLMTDITTEKMIREFRVTVQHDIADHAKPTRAECITVFKTLPHFDWTKDDDFYIQDTSGSKLVLIKYRAGNATDEATAGVFHYEILTTAV